VVLRFLCREPFPTAYVRADAGDFEYAIRVEVGLLLAVLGLVIFNIGLSYGLIQLGSTCGAHIGPLSQTNITIALIVAPFSFFLGLMATLAEPALNALGVTVERLSEGQFKKQTLILAVAVGVASGVLLGILRILFRWKLLYVIVPGYAITLLLTYFSSKEYVAIAWDSAGVTTGPVTVPLVLALGMGVSSSTGSGGGFGILSCASFCPIMSVLVCGLVLDRGERMADNFKQQPETDIQLQIESPGISSEGAGPTAANSLHCIGEETLQMREIRDSTGPTPGEHRRKHFQSRRTKTDGLVLAQGRHSEQDETGTSQPTRKSLRRASLPDKLEERRKAPRKRLKRKQTLSSMIADQYTSSIF